MPRLPESYCFRTYFWWKCPPGKLFFPPPPAHRQTRRQSPSVPDLRRACLIPSSQSSLSAVRRPAQPPYLLCRWCWKHRIRNHRENYLYPHRKPQSDPHRTPGSPPQSGLKSYRSPFPYLSRRSSYCSGRCLPDGWTQFPRPRRRCRSPAWKCPLPLRGPCHCPCRAWGTFLPSSSSWRPDPCTPPRDSFPEVHGNRPA